MGRLTVQSPALWEHCLTCAGGRALARKAAIWMRNNGDSFAMLHDGELLAVVYLVPDAEGRREFCLVVRPGARAHMGKLCRLAHSTLTVLADHGVVVISHVNSSNRAGQRMARLCGFRDMGDTVWIFEGETDGPDCKKSVRRREQRCEAASSKEPGAAAGGE